jgi:hypothetical protein
MIEQMRGFIVRKQEGNTLLSFGGLLPYTLLFFALFKFLAHVLFVLLGFAPVLFFVRMYGHVLVNNDGLVCWCVVLPAVFVCTINLIDEQIENYAFW